MSHFVGLKICHAQAVKLAAEISTLAAIELSEAAMKVYSLNGHLQKELGLILQTSSAHLSD